MKKAFIGLFLFASIALCLISCQKGATGPQGLAGANGETGPGGPDTVIYSLWIPVTMSIAETYVDSIGNTDTLFSDNIPAPVITQDILDSGMILSYLSFIDSTGATNVVSAAPYFSSEIFQVGQIILNSINVDLSTGYSYRYVVLPGTLLATNSYLKTLSKAQLKTADYAFITKALDLPSARRTGN
jgi:hypothetical protein